MPGVQPQRFGKARHLSEHQLTIFIREMIKSRKYRTGDTRVESSKK